MNTPPLGKRTASDRRNGLFFTVLACVGIAALVLALALGYKSFARDGVLRQTFGSSMQEIDLISSARERGILFGDSSSAWHVRFKRERLMLPPQARLSDKSDLDFATQNIELMLGTPLAGLKTPTVHRMRVNRNSVYLVRDGQERDVFVYVLTN